jgi:hypothetical protein
MLIAIGLQYSHGVFDRYPSFFRVLAMLAFASQSRTYDGERSEVTYSGPFDAQVNKIVLIVDESVRADVLGVNGYEKATTPYLSSLQAGVVNFGLAAASSNCSDYSNLILRTGVIKDDIPDRNQMTLKKPSIWLFTRKAGFHNVYLDAQSAEEWANYQLPEFFAGDLHGRGSIRQWVSISLTKTEVDSGQHAEGAGGVAGSTSKEH